MYEKAPAAKVDDLEDAYRKGNGLKATAVATQNMK